MLIEATDVTKEYGDVTALDDLSLSIPSGSTFGLLGTNGAGKTTLFRLLIGHEQPDEGRLRIGNTTVSTAGPRVRERVGYLPERVGFPPELTAREVFELTGRVRGDDLLERRIPAVLETVGLADAADRPVEGFSNGMRRRLGLATALLGRPDVLLLDEPTAGLDPLGVADFHRIVESVSERSGTTVVVCSHALAEVERLCDRVAILHDARLAATGDLGELADGADGRWQIRVACEDRDEAERVRALCDTVGDPRRHDGAVTVVVQDDDVLDVLPGLAELVGIDGIDLRTRGLERAFESALPGHATAERGGGPS